MIIDHIANAKRYECLHRFFPAAFEFLRKTDLRTLADGRHEIDGDNVFAIAAHSPGKGRDKAALEIHRKYIDVQFIIDGPDEIGFRSLHECRSVRDSYDAARDAGFFSDPCAGWITLPTDNFAIFYPQHAHAPLASDHPVHKVVVKVIV